MRLNELFKKNAPINNIWLRNIHQSTHTHTQKKKNNNNNNNNNKII